MSLFQELHIKGLVGSPDTDIALIVPKSDVMWYPEGIYRYVCELNVSCKFLYN